MPIYCCGLEMVCGIRFRATPGQAGLVSNFELNLHRFRPRIVTEFPEYLRRRMGQAGGYRESPSLDSLKGAEERVLSTKNRTPSSFLR